MAIMIANNWPIIQILLPLFGALVVALLGVRYARILATFIASLTLIVNAYGIASLEGTKRYLLGGWSAPIGIEYRLDNFSQPVLCCLSSILLFVLIFCRQEFITQVEEYISTKYRNILYSIILLAHAGLCGIVATNDLFNLYVFLEIASLGSYALVSLGRDKRALIGALHYLIVGTIGASLILIGIGMIYAITGSLNIDDIHIRMQEHYQNRILILGLGLFISGSFLKIALFPLHFWMIKAYRFATPAILSFLAPASSIVSFYILIRFIYFTCGPSVLYDKLSFGNIILGLSSCAIIINSYLAFKSETTRGIILYSSAAQIGYSCLALIIPSPEMLSVAVSYVLSSALIKMSLFMILSSEKKEELQDGVYKKVFSFLIIITLLSNAGIPLTIGFLNKVNILSIFLETKSYIAMAVIIGSSVIAIEYNYRLFKMLPSSDSGALRLLILNIVSFALVFLNAMLVQWT